MSETARISTFTIVLPIFGNERADAEVRKHLARAVQSAMGNDFLMLDDEGRAINFDPVIDDGHTPPGYVPIPSSIALPEFEQIIAWLRGERGYVIRKWGAEQDEEHVLEGMDEGSWLWDRVIANYTQRVRLIGIEAPRGKQAYMKIISSLVGLGEALIRARGPLPEPGHESGELGES